MIEILRSGPINSVQDLGRRGHLRWGVGSSGAMDPVSLQMGNLLLGNSLGEAGIEVAIFPFQLRFGVDCAFALTGAPVSATLDEIDLPLLWASRARVGQVLTLSPPREGVFSYITFAGGLDVAPKFGSRSTDLKSGFGGVEGRSLRAGDTLSLGPPCSPSAVPFAGYGISPWALARDWDWKWGDTTTSIRVLPAAEWAEFDEESINAFEGSAWTVTREVNRMGYGLSGPAMKLSAKRELRSHGIVPGTIQVPPSGQPIVQMSEANTCGGYPKVAVVIEADLWRLAQTRSGKAVRFRAVDWTEAMQVEASAGSQLKCLATLLEISRERSTADPAVAQVRKD